MIMNNFELIDDYLTNRLSAEGKEGFEKQLESDPTLKADVEFQRQVLEGIRSARAAELKSMLDKVPVGGGMMVDFSVTRMAAGIVGAGMLGAALYFYFKPEQVPDLHNAAADLAKKGEQIQKKQEEVIQPVDEAEVKSEEIKPEAEIPKETKSNKKKVLKKEETTSDSKPKLDVLDPSEEMTDHKNEPALSESAKGSITASHIEVETDTANKKYNFHYQFASGKLFLYGSFDKTLYEILEINSDNHSVFLYYRENYYLLDEKQIKITKLEPIKDSALIRKLKDYHHQ
jgi:hypothetical protein